MNQRAGKMHAASMNDAGGGTIVYGDLLKFVRAAQTDLEHCGEEDAALRFEILGDYLENDYKVGTPLKFTSKALGL
jgi:hypothetical protein